MANTSTTPAPVASRLTDEDIAVYASIIESSSRLSPDGKCNIATVLRDYMRLRKLTNAVEDAFVKFAVEYEFRIIENADTRDKGREELANDENWQALKRLIVETENGGAE